MSRPEPGRTRPHPDTSVGGARAVTRSLVADADHWVSAPRVRQAIGAWAYAAATPERRPAESTVRDAVNVAGALCELARAGELPWGAGSPDEAGDGRAARLRVGALDERTGLDAAATGAALLLLERAGALTRRPAPAGDLVLLAGDLLSAQPAVARLDWDETRRRLRAVGASLAPALAVLRELAAALGALAEGEAPPPVRLSVRDLEERTGYGRSTVSDALGALERARILDVETRAGRTARFSLRPAAFGTADEPPRSAPTEAPAAPPGIRATATSPGTAARPGAGAAPVLLGHFGGTPIHGPPGTPLVLECDAAGRWSCRVGPLLTLGPIAPD